MVAPLHTNKVFLLWTPGSVVVVPDHANRGVYRIGTTLPKKNAGEPLGSQLTQTGRQANSRLAAEVKVARSVGQSGHLLCSGGHDGGLAVSHVDAPQTRKGILHALAVHVCQVHPFGTLPNRSSNGFVLLQGNDGMHPVLTIKLDQFLAFVFRKRLRCLRHLNGSYSLWGGLVSVPRPRYLRSMGLA